MLRVLSLVFVLVVAAAGAQAASISVGIEYFGDRPFDPAPGELIVLTITGTANAGETGTVAFGRLFLQGQVYGYDSEQFLLTSFGGALPWLEGSVGCDVSSCDVFNQIAPTWPQPVAADNTPLVLARVTLVVTAVTFFINAHWDPNEFAFFDAPVPPDICILGPACPIIPEPATGALLALGLFAFATAARRRTR